jgi:CMP-N-acetylneuraminic acid synthetase
MNGSFSTNRQALPKCFIPNGAIFLTRVETLKKYRSFFGPCCLPYVMDEERSINIDSELDFRVAQLLMLERQQKDRCHAVAN